MSNSVSDVATKFIEEVDNEKIYSRTAKNYLQMASEACRYMITTGKRDPQLAQIDRKLNFFRERTVGSSLNTFRAKAPQAYQHLMQLYSKREEIKERFR